MRTVYLIGNGFDVNLGLPTKYIDFYNHYLGLDRTSDTANVSKLKDHLQTSLSSADKYWSDLEEAMGNYTSFLSAYDEVEEVFDNINDQMQLYVETIEKSELPKGIKPELLKKNLSTPENFLTPAEQEIIKAVYNKVTNDTHHISIVNFNYTTTIEKILGFSSVPIDLGKASYNSGYLAKLDNIYHIHGGVENPILGINDISQIANVTLREDIDVQKYLIKPKINSTLGHLIDRFAKERIENAHLICIYGLSLGNTDELWWKTVGRSLVNGATVILFIFDKDNNNLVPRKIGKYKRSWKMKFCEAAKIQENQRATLLNRIIVAPNTPIFDINK